ncbi:uncharacterized protein LOC143855860 [Tasmannia lanceolata]|uniref:uncharacterized protein LOC143855860 n=1 Tax=Tasmannia lanceolata TaxID=3420 RepID=UPI004062EE2E
MVPIEESEDPSLLAEESTLSQQSKNPLWMLYVDGSSNAGGNGVGLVITGPDNLIAKYALHLDFKASNNEAEYEALIAGIALATELQVSRIRVQSDSQLIVQVPRTLNTRPDALSKMASSGMFEPGNIYTETLPQPSVERKEVLQLSEEPSWMDPIIRYLKDGIIPSDRKGARRLVAKAAHYILDGQKLYKRSFSWPLLKCLRTSAAELAMREVHEGICGDHSGGKVLAHKILRRGFF